MIRREVTDHEILEIRKGWQAGLTLRQTAERLKKRFGYDNKPKLIEEWKKMRKLFGCASLPYDYLLGYYPTPKEAPSQQELNTFVGPLCANYGEWAGITGPGARLREMLKRDREEK